MYTLRPLTLTIVFFSFLMTSSASAGQTEVTKRVPAEWKPQEALWLQWPGRYEKSFEDAFAKMANVVVNYQKLNILHDSNSIRDEARRAIKKAGGNPDHPNIVWHAIKNDSAWMRDNGPVFIIENGEMRVQNWQFDAWGDAFGANIPYARDNKVPSAVRDYLGLPVDLIDIVHERGNLEFNGVDTVMLNWSAIGDTNRNPGYTKEKARADLKHHFGVSKVVLIEGIPEGDLTKGHIDGIARFINPTTVVVVQCTNASQCKSGEAGNGAIFDAAADTIAAAGFKVIRDPIEGVSKFQNDTFDTNYMNWIVGNGFVIVERGPPPSHVSRKLPHPWMRSTQSNHAGVKPKSMRCSRWHRRRFLSLRG